MLRNLIQHTLTNKVDKLTVRSIKSEANTVHTTHFSLYMFLSLF